MQNKRPILIVLTTMALLLIPFIAMKFTDEVNWKPMDFVVAGALLLGTGVGIEVVLRNTKNIIWRIVISLILIIILLIIWAELAVGIFDSPIGGG